MSEFLTFKARWQESLSEVVRAYQKQHIEVDLALDQTTRKMDDFIELLIDESLKAIPETSVKSLREDIAILAVGGYGRRQMFPYSDVDLLITYDTHGGAFVEKFSSELVRQCWDSGLKLGQAIRSINDTVSLARDESQVATALIETRLLWGNAALHTRLRARFESWLQKSRRSFLDHCEASRKKEIEETALAVYSLEPDVKRSPGTLRDLQLILWAGFARYEVTGFQALADCGGLKPEVAEFLIETQKYLSTIRMNLHVHAGRSQDVLTRQEQLWLTDQEGISDYQGQRAVERYMQQYFQKADFVARTSRRFIELCKPTTFQERVSARVYRRIIDETYIVLNGRLNVVSHNVKEVISSLESILHAFTIAAEHKVRISSRLIESIRNHVSDLPRDISEEASSQFISLLNRVGSVGTIVRDLYECGILEILIPQFTHARGLLQFNNYHAYTVDEHTFRVLEGLDQLSRESPTKEIVAKLRKPWVLSLAMLIHDLGKGYEQDHSQLGAQIAIKTAARLGLQESDASTIEMLVLEHLSMSLLAFRRDTSDPLVVAEFARTVQEASKLRKLYLLTICDIKAVGPGIWNDWKAQLLAELYERTSLSLSGKFDKPELEQQLKATKEKAIQLYAKSNPSVEDQKRLTSELNEMPDHYLMSASAANIVQDMQIAMRLTDHQLEIIDRYDEETNTLELIILTRQHGTERCFHRMTGVLTAAQMSILTADIYTSGSGFICDRFLVQDNDSPNRPLPGRLDKVREELTKAVERPISFEQLFQKQRRYQTRGDQQPISNQRPHVSMDNDTSRHATIIDVFAHDRPGLLFTLSKAIYDLDLSITLARITTHVDLVVDVFYVTDLNNKKIKEDYVLNAIASRLEHVIDEFDRHGYRLFIS
ncbi:[protein-PII] uridylyltransferase [Rubinisphaera italica]|uniref:Bifunctional uridylyltransferase/uridylyl-removing enzyme n=1 Tax=Rubinisphaera italica TaxID=2527969 RepID=A0A5C5XLI8_9PLAN|nr:[protein-PII] uridylyltransferase [Rubinisphaera italica]TWT62582.1 Bifunctional uridylyltransferase/uridylyl-removing enzyme [Rubinisphaera italica]